MKTKTLTYWMARCLDDSTAYSIREPLRRDVLSALAEFNCRRELDVDSNVEVYKGDYGRKYELPEKVTIYYSNDMDLARCLLGEGRSGY